MAYSVSWDETAPDGSTTLANTIDTELQNLKISMRERLEDYLPGWNDDTQDPKTTYRCRVSLTTNEAITTGTDTDIPWDQADYEENATDWWDAGSATQVLIPANGCYTVLANVLWDTGTTGYRMIEIVKNNVTPLAFVRNDAESAGVGTAQSIAWEGELVDGDYVELRVHHTQGSNQNVITTTTFMSVKMVP